MPMQNAEVDDLKSQLDGFFLEIRAFRGGFRKNAPFEPSEGLTADAVYLIIDEYVNDTVSCDEPTMSPPVLVHCVVHIHT